MFPEKRNLQKFESLCFQQRINENLERFTRKEANSAQGRKKGWIAAGAKAKNLPIKLNESEIMCKRMVEQLTNTVRKMICGGGWLVL